MFRRRFGFLSPAAQVQGQPGVISDLPWPVIIVTFIQTQMLWVLRRWRRPKYRDRLQGFGQDLVVENVRASDHEAERDAAAIGHDRALGPGLAPVGGIGAGFFSPPSGALVIAPSTDSHSQSIPATPQNHATRKL